MLLLLQLLGQKESEVKSVVGGTTGSTLDVAATTIPALGGCHGLQRRTGPGGHSSSLGAEPGERRLHCSPSLLRPYWLRLILLIPSHPTSAQTRGNHSLDPRHAAQGMADYNISGRSLFLPSTFCRC